MTSHAGGPEVAQTQTLSKTLDWFDPVNAFAPFARTPWSLLLHDAVSGRSRLFIEPGEVCEGQDRETYDAWTQQVRNGPQCGIWAGLLGYDLAGAFERLPTFERAAPDLAMGYYPAWLEFDETSRTVWLKGQCQTAMDPFLAVIKAGQASGKIPCHPAPAGGVLSPLWSRDAYIERARQARDYVHAGDVFQLNLSQRFSGKLGAHDTPYDVFRRLMQDSPAPHAAFFCLSRDRVLATHSPERFIAVTAGAVETRPIKGTRPRGATLEQDQALAAELLDSGKDRAENLMIVDLMRNDLSRVCVTGSVKVPQLCGVETYSNVHHLVSSVTGRLAEGTDTLDLLAASFPPGSITGAPKVRAMEIIAELEGEARGAYCGALGWMSGTQTLDLNVMIRTVMFERAGLDWSVVIRSGGGIVAESDPQAEYEETLTKASGLFHAITGHRVMEGL